MALSPHPLPPHPLSSLPLADLPDGPVAVDVILREARREQGRALRRMLAALGQAIGRGIAGVLHHRPGLPAH